MNGRYKGRIKVVSADLLCFAADPVTLEPLTTGCYDTYAWSGPDPEPVETIDASEWNRRRAALREGGGHE